MTNSKTVLITGASRGIGRSTALEFAKKNYNIIIEEIIDDVENDLGIALGRAWFQAPEVDGACIVSYDLDDKKALNAIQPGKVVMAKVLGVTGVDLNTVYLG